MKQEPESRGSGISRLQAGEDVKSCDTYPALARNILQRNGIEPARQQTGSIRREGAAPLGA